MWWKLSTAFVVLVAFSGCILEPDLGENPIEGNPITGVVSMQDITSSDPIKGIIATFSKKEDRKFLKVLPEWTNGTLELFPQFGLNALSSSRAINCEIKKTELRTEEASLNRALISVGKLQCGPAGSSDLLTVSENSEHIYQRIMNTGIPTGLYQIRAKGSADAPAFGGNYLSVPEPLYQVQADGVGFEKGNILIERDKDLKLEWQMPAMPNDANKMIFMVEVKGFTHKHTLQCIADERDFYLNEATLLQWTISKEFFGKLPTSTDVDITFMRAHLGELKGNVSIAFQGIRSWETDGAIED